MPVCPRCHRAYPVGAEVCEECDVRLGTSDPLQGELFEVVELYDLPDEITGLALRSFLAEQGIEANLRQLQASFYGITLKPGGGLWGKLVVAKEQETQARALIERFLTEFHGR